MGGSGLIVNLSIFYLFNNIFGIDVNLSSIFSFISSSLNNYAIHTLWTFKKNNPRFSLFNYLKYVSANFTGLIINISILNVVILIYGSKISLYAQLFGVLAGTLFNYLISSKFVFRANKPIN